jgi:hypothetical protein
MKQEKLIPIIQEQTDRALWEVKNVIDCVPEDLWNKRYCEMPMWKHIYHMLHSLDLWFINPRDEQFVEPSIHQKDLNNLDIITEITLSKKQIDDYFNEVNLKIRHYLTETSDEELLSKPPKCEYDRFTLILAQYRHLHTHLGMIMGFIIADTGKWPRVLGLENPIPENREYDKFF